MREIKFRVWNIENKKLVYVDLREAIEFDCVYSLCGKQESETSVMRGQCECELMQFTGLLDKDGKEIYEGDIVKMSSWLERKKYSDAKKKDCEGIFVVKVRKDYFGVFEFDFENISGYKCPTHLQMHENNPFKVIGNIRENPELLEDVKR